MAKECGIATHKEDDTLNGEDGTNDVFDSDLYTVIGCEDDYELDEQTKDRVEFQELRADSVTTQMKPDLNGAQKNAGGRKVGY